MDKNKHYGGSVNSKAPAVYRQVSLLTNSALLVTHS